jgi:ferric-dicitrate binding protein FerR (iron transport regulator)
MRPFNWMQAAAILVMLAIGGGLAYYFTGQNRVEMLTAQSGANPLIDTLPDGTVITLNKNSSITYPSKFEGNTRLVTLKGEAFFDVAHDKTKPFIIDADNASIKVVGTSFNVKSNALKTEIVVETGIVEVKKMENVIRVVHNQKAIVTKDKAAPEMETNTDQLYNYYRTKEFVCDNTPLWKLAEILNEAYDVNINIPDASTRNLPLSTTFHDEPLDDILKVVCATLNLHMERNGKGITLK